MSKSLVSTLVAVLLVSLAGCGTPDQHVKMFFEQVAVPTVDKMIANNPIQTGMIEGDVQGVEPGYVGEFEGYWVVGIKGKVSLFAKGVSGRLGGHAQFGGEKAATQPAVTP